MSQNDENKSQVIKALRHCLDKNCDELIKKFYSLRSGRDVARLLEIPYGDLVYYLYVIPYEFRYTTFQIPKKLGGTRIISTPATSLKLIQKKLNQVLQCVYQVKPSVHGFVKNKNIVTNAKAHIGKRYVLNFDLKDFFVSINFGRVRGMFMALPYALSPEVATVLAQICCHDDQLPQGAPTSPNDKLLKACDLLEKEYPKKPVNLEFPNIYLPRNQYNPHKLNSDDYYYISNKELYLSLTNLKEAKIIFTLELCFLVLYGGDFYKKNNNIPYGVNSQTLSKALKRPTPKLDSSVEPLNKKFYYLIDAARQFRNIIEHNKTHSKEQEKKLQELRNKRHIKDNYIENNYDGILEAVTWFIRQIYFDMTKN